MTVSKFLKDRKKRIWLTVFVILILLGLSVYFVINEPASIVAFFNQFFAPNISKTLPAIIPIILAFIVGLLGNFLASDVGETFKDEKPVEVTVKTEYRPIEEPQPRSKDETFKGFNRSFPNVPDYFTGREQVLKDLENTLKTHRQASFYGTHGLGKTRTAIEYARRHQEKYDLILFVSAVKGNFINNAAFAGAEISEEIKDAQSLEAKYNLLIEYLQNHPNWLIICDNVEDIPEVVGKIPKHFDGNVIYTSNHREIEDVAPPVKIEAMTRNEAELALLRRRARDNKAKLEDVLPEEREAITRIVEKIGTLPVGLNLAGAFIKKYQMNFREYLQDYEKFEDETFQDFDIADYYGEEFIKGLSEAEKAEYKGIAGVFLLSYRRIVEPKDDSDKEKLISRTIVAILNLSAFLAPEKVPEEIWTTGLSLFDEDLAKAAEDKLFWLEVRDRLAQSAFFVRDENEDTLSTHRLILMILQKRLSEEEKRRFAEIAVDSVNELFPWVEFKSWNYCNRLLRHAETTLDHAEDMEIQTQKVTRICNQIALYSADLAEYEKAIIFYQKALEIDEKIVGKEHSNYATRLHNLATVYRKQGRYDEALEKFEEALQIDEKTIGKEHPSYAIRLNNLANVYYSQSRYEEAIEKYKEAMRITEKTVGKEHPSYAIRLNNLANVYYSQGRYDEAIKKYEGALRIGEKTIGKEHPEYAQRLSNLAFVYESQGKYKEALNLHEEALRIDLKTLPENHPYTIQDSESVERCRKKL